MAPSAILPEPEPEYVVVHAGKGTIKRQILKGDQKKPTFETIPEVDFTNMSSPLLEERKGVAEKVGAAFKDSGFLYAVNHGIDERLQDELYDVIKEFFALPLEEKMKVSALRKSRMTSRNRNEIDTRKQIRKHKRLRSPPRNKTRRQHSRRYVPSQFSQPKTNVDKWV
jgi:isopenicillin N synthase-like dioxygenase